MSRLTATDEGMRGLIACLGEQCVAKLDADDLLDERERYLRDPALYVVMNRLHDAYDELVEALYERLNATGIAIEQLVRNLSWIDRDAIPPRLSAARCRVDCAQTEWAEAVAAADELLASRAGN